MDSCSNSKQEPQLGIQVLSASFNRFRKLAGDMPQNHCDLNNKHRDSIETLLYIRISIENLPL
jgi:hypothetical protein